jgi:hypothetical protein
VRAGAGKLGGARGGSGGCGATWRSRERASAGCGAVGAVLERHVARRERRESRWGSGNRPVRAAGSGAERSRVGGLEVDEGGLVCNL